MPDLDIPPEKSAGSASRKLAGQEVVVAGFWRRALAALVDTLIVSPVLVLFFWLAKVLTGYSFPAVSQYRLETVLELVIGGGGLLYSAVAMMLVLVLLYMSLFLLISGATPGLKLLRLQVINVYGQAPEVWRVALRAVGFIVSCGLLGLGFLWIGFDREKRGLPDWFAGTYVIRGRA